jgi:UDP-N-acetylmuramate dehydrogenase
MKVNLASYNTLNLGGPCQDFQIANTEAELITFVQEADQAGIPLAIIGDGSNLYFSDQGFAGRVIKVSTKGNSYEFDACSGGMLTVSAGENWDELVQFTLAKGLANLESLSGIPGTVGAAPIQNIGAYGHEVSEVIARVRTYDRKEKSIRTFTNSELNFSYRNSIFKIEANRYVILDVTFQLRKGEFSLPILYQELAEELNLSINEKGSTQQLRAAVLKLRAKKGMLLESGFNSAGSFFTNPIISKEAALQLPEGAPTWESAGSVKVSAAWLIQNAGFEKGYTKGNVGISPKHVLALINLGGTAMELNQLAKEISDKVEAIFGIKITKEVSQL